MPRVYNLHREDVPSGAAFVGRSTKWGNPFVIGKDGDREMVVWKYREYLLSNEILLQQVRRELRGRDLACFCAPAPCHADVLLEVANGG